MTLRRHAVLEGHRGGHAATARSARRRCALPRAGFYTYRERIVGHAGRRRACRRACGEETETSLARPLILTGRGDPGAARAPAAFGRRRARRPRPPPSRRTSRCAGSGSTPTVYGVDIDTRLGVLDVPQNIDRVGWWRDGAAPGASAGTILLAGHVDSARRGAGAFYALKGARRGDTITVRSGAARRAATA